MRLNISVYAKLCVFSLISNHTLSFSVMFELCLGKLSNTVRLPAVTQYPNLNKNKYYAILTMSQ